MCLFAGALWKETRWEKSVVRNRASQNVNVSRYTSRVSKMAGNDWIADRSVQQLYSLSFSAARFLYRWFDRTNRCGKMHKHGIPRPSTEKAITRIIKHESHWLCVRCFRDMSLYFLLNYAKFMRMEFARIYFSLLISYRVKSHSSIISINYIFFISFIYRNWETERERNREKNWLFIF